jgi:hypothetical protein
MTTETLKTHGISFLLLMGLLAFLVSMTIHPLMTSILFGVGGVYFLIYILVVFWRFQ